MAATVITLASPMTSGSQINSSGQYNTPGKAIVTGVDGEVTEMSLDHSWFDGLTLTIDLRTGERSWKNARGSITHDRNTSLEINLPDLHQCFSFYSTQHLTKEWLPIMTSILDTPLPEGTMVDGFDHESLWCGRTKREVKTYREAFFLIGIKGGFHCVDGHSNHKCEISCKLDKDDKCLHECHHVSGEHVIPNPKDCIYRNSVSYEDSDGQWKIYPMPGYPDSVGLDLEIEGTTIGVGYSR